MTRNFIREEDKQACLAAIQDLVAFPSILQEHQTKTPFGQPIQDALEFTLDFCRQLGFSTYLDPAGYYGYAEVGQGQKLLAILCHLDVVPAGDLTKWKTPPFEAVIKDGLMIGRGGAG